ncbi:MAG: glycosyl transferase [Ignavibacteriota bacterium]|nr:MAG: glycosyl transferase [Ignavibacteriota bacterium]
MKISIITVAKNNKAGLLGAIECVRKQTYKNVEHIIVDGGSTDGTVEILKQVQDDIRSAQYDSRLTTNYSLLTISETDSGIYDAINKGIRLAAGDVIGLLHSDDLYADENVLERYAEIFKRPFDFAQGDNVDAVYSDLVYVRKKREVRGKKLKDEISEDTNHRLPTTYSTIRYWKTHKSVSSNQSSVNNKNTEYCSLVTDHLLKKGWMPPHPTLFIRKELFTKYGFYRTDMKIAADYEMILRLLYKHKINSHYLPITTYLMSIGGASNKSLKNILQKSKEDYLAMKINGISIPVFTLVSKNLRKLPQFLAHDVL